MTKFKSDFLNVMEERGFLHQATDLVALDNAAAKGVITSYVGFDATADSFHIGNLVQIMLLRWLQKTGHRPIALMGGGTTKIGDPSGKDELRKLKTDEEINANVSRLQQTFAQYIAFGTGKTDGMLVNNAEWLDKLEYVPFLRDVGRHFSINRMLTFDSVKLRLEREQPLSFLEFNYMILQGYDFVELNRRYGCILQTGGADQWGNIVNGVDLGRRISKETLFGLTTNLITLPSGEKMGKSVAGAVWVNADRMSAYDYYQYWRNVDDSKVTKFLKLFTELPLNEIARLGDLEGAEINEAKKVLALEATALCHGRTAATKAADTARDAFENHHLAEGLPTVDIASSELLGMQIAELAVRAGLAPSKSEARRLIKQGGVVINNHKPVDEHAVLDNTLVVSGDTMKLSAGKKRIVLVKIT